MKLRHGKVAVVALFASILGLTACGSNNKEEVAPAITSATTTSSTASTTDAPVITDQAAVPSLEETDPSTSTSSTTTALPTTTTTPLATGFGTISFPILGTSGDLIEGLTDEQFNHGCGYHPASVLPGQLGWMIIGCHRTHDPHLLLEIEKLVDGEIVEVTDSVGIVYRYKVVFSAVVPYKADGMGFTFDPKIGKAMMFLFACSHEDGSAGGTSHRQVRFLELVP